MKCAPKWHSGEKKEWGHVKRRQKIAFSPDSQSLEHFKHNDSPGLYNLNNNINMGECGTGESNFPITCENEVLGGT